MYYEVSLHWEVPKMNSTYRAIKQTASVLEIMTLQLVVLGNSNIEKIKVWSRQRALMALIRNTCKCE